MKGRHQVLAYGLALAALATFSGRAEAQRVSAHIRIGGGPVSGTVHVGDYPRPRRVVYTRVFPRRVSIERRALDARRIRNARVVVLYYDRDCDLYFDRYRRGLVEVRVYQERDRFYRLDPRDRRWDRDRGRDRDRDRYDRRDDRDRRDRDDDYGAWEHDHH
ncbi:MAG: hypothetical protein AB7S39_03730 [Gemmatimonadales bacterium]